MGSEADNSLRTGASIIARFAIRNYTLSWGLAVLTVMLLIAISAPLLSAYDPLALNAYARLRPPSSAHWFGTDSYGRDIFSRTLFGTRVSLIVGGVSTFVAVALGVVLGLLSGYFRKIDLFTMRFMDALMALPMLLLAIALMAMLGSSIKNVIIAIAIVQIPRMARVVRSSVLSLREATFVEAAKVIGAKPLRILAFHILPNTIAPLMVQASYVFAAAILVEAVLSFLGAGNPPIIPSWGNIMAEGRSYIQSAVWITLFPGIFLTLTVLAVNLIGDSLRDILDPKLRGRL
jgi:peptide/nickel transport system permease protein